MSVLGKVLLLEDSAVYSDGLKSIIVQEFSGVEIVQMDSGTLQYTEEVTDTFDLVIAGESVCHNDVIDVFDLFASKKIPLLIVTDKNDGVIALNYIKLGARAVLPKTAFPLEIVTACKTILNNSVYFSHDLIRSYSNGCLNGKRNGDAMSLLSKKEKTVLLLMAEGYRLKEICSIMGLAISTVSTMKKRILEKLDINSTYELVQFMSTQINSAKGE